MRVIAGEYGVGQVGVVEIVASAGKRSRLYVLLDGHTAPMTISPADVAQAAQEEGGMKLGPSLQLPGPEDNHA